MHEICWCIHSQFSSWTGQWVALRPRRGLRWAESTLVILGIYRCRVPVGLFASLTSWSSWRTMGWIRGSRQERWVGRGSHSNAWEIHKSASTFTTKCQSLPVKEEEENLAVTSLLKALHVDAVEDSTLSLVAWVVTSSLCVRLCVCVWGTSLALLLVKPLNRKAAAMSIIWEADL